MGLNSILDFFVPPGIRRIANSPSDLFLSFDDGPHPVATPQVLDVLHRTGAKATFFLVAQKAQNHPDIVQRILSEGHSIGNHSLDHRYGAFFGGRSRMLKWIDDSETVFERTGIMTVGFRPPVGIRTPELGWALRKREIPMILWNVRFFDTTFEWNKDKAERSLRSTHAGDIVLLHDSQDPSRMPGFLETLEHYIHAANRAGFSFPKLTRELCRQQIKNAL